jgi:hypothetical protein
LPCCFDGTDAAEEGAAGGTEGGEFVETCSAHEEDEVVGLIGALELDAASLGAGIVAVVGWLTTVVVVLVALFIVDDCCDS